MTATLVEPGLVSRHTAPDLAPILFHVLSAQPSTPLDLAGVRDPSVRAALASMDDEVSGALYGRPQSAITVLTASEVITSALGAAIGVVVRVASAAADALAKPAEAQATRHPDSAFEAVGYVAEALGLPARDVCRAVGVAPRTYYSWRDGVVPRLHSQGLLWKLVQVTQDLGEILGGEDAVAKWMRADPGHREVVAEGRFDRLVQDALLATTPRVESGEDPARRALARLAAVGGDADPDEDSTPPAPAARRGPATGRRVAARTPRTGDPRGRWDQAQE